MPEHRTPKVFISYSWSSPEYGERVIDFVNDLRAAGVEVVFDRLDLTEGQDKYAFMERAVTDPSVDRVLVLCDPLYADKADGRRGGVGTETQIMSPQVYGSADQKKFIPVIMERDGDQIRVPTYLNTSLYFDLSGPDRIVHFERLVRRLHGKPDLERSPLGPPPSYLNERRPELRTGRALDIFKDTVERERAHQTVRRGGVHSSGLHHLGAVPLHGRPPPTGKPLRACARTVRALPGSKLRPLGSGGPPGLRRLGARFPAPRRDTQTTPAPEPHQRVRRHDPRARD